RLLPLRRQLAADALRLGTLEDVLQPERCAPELLRAERLALDRGCVMEQDAARRRRPRDDRQREGNERVRKPLLVDGEPRHVGHATVEIGGSSLRYAGDDELAESLTSLHHAVRLRDLLEREHTRGAGAVVAGFDLFDDRVERNRRQRERIASEFEAPEEAELHAARQVDDRKELIDRPEAAQESGLA